MIGLGRESKQLVINFRAFWLEIRANTVVTDEERKREGKREEEKEGEEKRMSGE